MVGHTVYTLLKGTLGLVEGLLPRLAVAAQVQEVQHLDMPPQRPATPQQGRVKPPHDGCNRRLTTSMDDLTPMKSTPLLSSLQALMGGSTEVTSRTQYRASSPR